MKANKQTLHLIRCAVLFLTTLICLQIMAGCGSSGSGTASTTDLVTGDSPPYAKLAAIEVGSRNPSPTLIEEFRVMLDRLSRKCSKDSQQNISDYIVTSQNLLKDKGRNMSLMEIASSVDKSIPDGEDMGKCIDIFTVFVASVK
jgi:hypothetical protein